MCRKCELADLSLLEFPLDEGLTPALAICMCWIRFVANRGIVITIITIVSRGGLV